MKLRTLKKHKMYTHTFKKTKQMQSVYFLCEPRRKHKHKYERELKEMDFYSNNFTKKTTK